MGPDLAARGVEVHRAGRRRHARGRPNRTAIRVVHAGCSVAVQAGSALTDQSQPPATVASCGQVLHGSTRRQSAQSRCLPADVGDGPGVLADEIDAETRDDPGLAQTINFCSFSSALIAAAIARQSLPQSPSIRAQRTAGACPSADAGAQCVHLNIAAGRATRQGRADDVRNLGRSPRRRSAARREGRRVPIRRPGVTAGGRGRRDGVAG